MIVLQNDIVTSLVAVLLLLVANAFFVAAEFALVKARSFRNDSLALERRGAAGLVVRIQRDLETYLAACQLGITMASLGLGWVGGSAVAAILEPLFEVGGLSERILHAAAFLAGFIAFSSLHIVVGGQVPKTLSSRRPESISLAVAYPLHAFFLLFYPLIWGLKQTSCWTLRPMRVAESAHAEALTDAQLRVLVEPSPEHGEEFDREESVFGLRPTADGWEAHGLAPLFDVERATGFAPGAFDANTLSGFLTQRLERMPRVGDEWIEGGYRLRVAEMDPRSVRRCDLIRVAGAKKSPESVPVDGVVPAAKAEG